MKRFGLALACSALVGALTLAAPAAADTTAPFRAIFVESGCAPLTVCGIWERGRGLGHVEQTVLGFNGCGTGLHAADDHVQERQHARDARVHHGGRVPRELREGPEHGKPRLDPWGMDDRRRHRRLRGRRAGQWNRRHPCRRRTIRQRALLGRSRSPDTTSWTTGAPRRAARPLKAMSETQLRFAKRAGHARRRVVSCARLERSRPRAPRSPEQRRRRSPGRPETAHCAWAARSGVGEARLGRRTGRRRLGLRADQRSALDAADVRFEPQGRDRRRHRPRRRRLSIRSRPGERGRDRVRAGGRARDRTRGDRPRRSGATAPRSARALAWPPVRRRARPVPPRARGAAPRRAPPPRRRATDRR